MRRITVTLGILIGLGALPNAVAAAPRSARLHVNAGVGITQGHFSPYVGLPAALWIVGGGVTKRLIGPFHAVIEVDFYRFGRGTEGSGMDRLLSIQPSSVATLRSGFEIAAIPHARSGPFVSASAGLAYVDIGNGEFADGSGRQFSMPGEEGVGFVVALGSGVRVGGSDGGPSVEVSMGWTRVVRGQAQMAIVPFAIGVSF